MSLVDFANIATIVGGFGLPLAALAFVLDQRKQARDRQLETYVNIAREYRDFLKLCVENSHLEIYDFRSEYSKELTQEEQLKKLILMDYLVSMFESAYFLYKDHDTDFKEQQWLGWQQYMRDWCRRPDFQFVWRTHLGSQYDKGFLEKMEEFFKAAQPGDPADASQAARH